MQPEKRTAGGRLSDRVLKDNNKRMDDMRSLADVNAAAVARVLRGWLQDTKKHDR